MESVNWQKKHRKKGALLKLYFKKAYDLVDCDFLEHMLVQVGLGDRMRFWLLWCVRSARLSMLVNGSPTVPFHVQKSLR